MKKRGRLLSPEEVRLGQEVIVVPQGDVARGVGLGLHPADGSLQRCTDALHGAARRGAVELYETPEASAAGAKAAAEARVAQAALEAREKAEAAAEAKAREKAEAAAEAKAREELEAPAEPAAAPATDTPKPEEQ